MHKNCPLVSVIIPTYNREKFIGDALQSALDQTYKNLEVLIVDDGSRDRTKEVVQSFQDKRIIYFYQENKGRSVARNLALKHAKGNYITFLDSDDLYYKDKIEKQVEFLENNIQFSMVYTSANCIDEEGNILKHAYQATDAGWIYIKVAYFVPTTITLPTVMVRQEVFSADGEFDENMHRFEDTDMWRRISKKYMIGAMPDVTCLLRTHDENSLKNQNPKEILNNLKYYINKILSEDEEYYCFHKRGFNKLLQYYKSAFSSVTDFSSYENEITVIDNYINQIIEIKRTFPQNQTQAQLQPTQAQLLQTQVQLKYTQIELQDTHAQLQDTQFQLQDTQVQLQGIQAQLKDTQTQLNTYQNHFLIKPLRKVKKICSTRGH